MSRPLLLLVCAFLGGCAPVTGDYFIECPKTAIVGELLKTVSFHQEIPIRTEMDRLTSFCIPEGDHILMDLRLRLTSFRPLTTSSTPFTVLASYFLAVVDEKGRIISRTDLEAELFFAEKELVAVSYQRLYERVPSQKVTVYVGFNLDETQINYLQKEQNKKAQPRSPGPASLPLNYHRPIDR